jgi:hypothetical protein
MGPLLIETHRGRNVNQEKGQKARSGSKRLRGLLVKGS